MASFVLVHGAWHGAWCWQRVIRHLAQAGHRCHAVTLTGVGDRAHLLRPDISLETHIADVCGLIEAEELQDVVLVVHSYAGMIGTGVADRMADRLAHLVFVDAVIPEPGEAWGSTHAPDTRATRVAAVNADPMRSLAPPDASLFGLSGVDRDWVNRRQTPHPGGLYSDVLNFSAATVAAIPRTFVSCEVPRLATIDTARERAKSAQTWGGLWFPRSRFVRMDTGHDPMVSAPEELARHLMNSADLT